jgi:hypothetical protein
MDQNRYVITSNIAHFQAQLRGGLLDLGQTHIVTGLLAEAQAALNELDLHSAATHPPFAPSPPPEPAPAA